MPVPQRILVPFDYSAAADAALRLAMDLARASGALLLVRHFVEVEIAMLGDYPLIKGDPLEREAERLRAHVAGVVVTAEGSSPECEIDVTWGYPVLRIVETVVEHAVDLIVMGTRAGSTAPHGGPGTVAEQVVRLAPCAVVTVPAPRDPRAAHAPSAAERPAAGRVAGVMSPRPVTIASDETLACARDRMAAAKIRHLPVVAAERVVGILSDVDFPAHRGRLGETAVHVAMTPDPVTIAPDDSVEAAARLMLAERVRALPVVDHDRLVGIVSAADILEDYVRVSQRAR